ncbi:RDD family protein [Streptomyces sp. NBC_01803]|uniref:RDD family protein n=1 Tax=Streptomyces sp. NBC_01803 TaxID=2975946 RepID=UPI002DD98079|nr:RDD family protein [Streptomyces sp. NBC_01803]WSA44460.1 RDD family protein [Streptomyces sp. NBC_01803]
MSQVVTGDAVVLGLQPARLPSRIMAVALDLTVFVGGYLLLSVVLLSTVLPLGSAAAAAVQVALLILVLVGGPVAVETLSRGRSLGKLVFGLRVVRRDGGPIRFRHALVRGVVGFVETVISAGAAPVITSLVSAEGRRLGDIFAGTLVVRERIPGSGRTAAPMPPPPPALAGEFAGLDLSRVPDGLWLAVRQYLARMEQLDERVAWSMAVRLAGDVVERVGAPAPAGTHPAAYLSGVLAERQRREAERAFGSPPAPSAAPGAPLTPPIPAVQPEPRQESRPQREARQEPGPERTTGFTPPS